MAAGSQLAELKDVQSPVIGISWTPDSQKIMACSMKGSVKIWDIQNIGKKKTTEQQVTPTVTTESTTTTTTNKVIPPVPTNDTQAQIPSTSTAIPVQTTLKPIVSNSNIQLLKSYETRCKRLIKMQYNSDYSMTFIGNN